jgi:hypothetical protein
LDSTKIQSKQRDENTTKSLSIASKEYCFDSKVFSGISCDEISAKLLSKAQVVRDFDSAKV